MRALLPVGLVFALASLLSAGWLGQVRPGSEIRPPDDEVLLQINTRSPLAGVAIATAVDPESGAAWTVTRAADGVTAQLTEFDPASGEPSRSLELPNDPASLLYDRHSRSLWVGEDETGALQRVRIAGWSLGERLTLDHAANHVTLDAQRHIAYFGSASEPVLSAVDLVGGFVLERVTVGETNETLCGLTLFPALRRLYVCRSSEQLTVLSSDLLNEELTIPIGNIPSALAVNPKLNRLYITVVASSTIQVFDATTLDILLTRETGSLPTGIRVNTLNGDYYTVNEFSQDITLFNRDNERLLDLPLGASPGAFSVDARRGRVWVPLLDPAETLLLDTGEERDPNVYFFSLFEGLRPLSRRDGLKRAISLRP